MGILHSDMNSSWIEGVGYRDGNLLVRLRHGETYCYHDVPQDVYESLLSAPSKGGYLNRHIKPRYAVTEL